MPLNLGGGKQCKLLLLYASVSKIPPINKRTLYLYKHIGSRPAAEFATQTIIAHLNQTDFQDLTNRQHLNILL